MTTTRVYPVAEWDRRYRAGETIRQIAATEALSITLIRRHLLAFGTPIRPKGRRAGFDHDLAVACLRAGMSMRAAGKQCGVSSAAIWAAKRDGRLQP